MELEEKEEGVISWEGRATTSYVHRGVFAAWIRLTCVGQRGAAFGTECFVGKVRIRGTD